MKLMAPKKNRRANTGASMMPTRKENRDAFTSKREPKRSFSGQGSSATHTPTRMFRHVVIKAEREFNWDDPSPNYSWMSAESARSAVPQ